MTKRIQLTRGYVALVDDEDYERVAAYKWCVSVRKHTAYAARTGPMVRGNTEPRIYMHRFILNAPKGMQVDHVNGDGLDNRRANLRLVSQRQNSQNSRARTYINDVSVKSEHKGVWANKGRFTVFINGPYGRRYVGIYLDERAAALAYDQAARLLHGEYARLNFPDEERVDLITKPNLEALLLKEKGPDRRRGLADWQVRAIRRAREEADLTYKQLADAFKTHRSTAREICRGLLYKGVT